MQPELWNPMDGTMRKLPEFTLDGSTTTVPVVLQKDESAFIVFRKKGKPVMGEKNFPDPVKNSTLNSAWSLTFESKLTNPSPIHLDQLQDLSLSTDNKVKYFSGNIIYKTNFEFDLNEVKGQDIYLDLGEVNMMAKVWVNDEYVGGVWTTPYSVNISKALKQGLNTLKIDVVNTWVNRLIGDSGLPKEERETWAGVNPYNPNSGLQKSGLVGPVQLKYLPNYRK